MRRAKIVCTIGPASSGPDVIRAMIESGMDVARLNLSHGDHAGHRAVFDSVRSISQHLAKPVAVLADLQGPKIRLGQFRDGQPVVLQSGAHFTITTDGVMGTKDRASTTFAGLPGDVSAGDLILLDDGRLSLRVEAVKGNDVLTTVVTGGLVSDHKGINLPGAPVSLPALTGKDLADLAFALALGVDWVALSFVRQAADYRQISQAMNKIGSHCPVLAKIEKPQAVDHLADVVEAFDGIMMARGDLGVELPLEQVPLVQKSAIDLARRHAKPVVVATQMLESMVTDPRPTRAEASDCANATLDGADALMLSAETSIGANPVAAVRTMARIIEYTESGGQDRMTRLAPTAVTRYDVLTKAASSMADELDAALLVAMTETGESARHLARLRNTVPLVALTPNPQVLRQLAIQWGVQAFEVPELPSTEQMVLAADRTLLAQGLASAGQTVVLIVGEPTGVTVATNQILVHRVGEADT